METEKKQQPQFNNRIGFHYYPDTIHYREQDLTTWLPQLKSLYASWLVLSAPVDRAIPESFIKGLIFNKIEPILHFDVTPENFSAPSEIEPILYAYSRWGVKKIIFFNKPNLRTSWSPAGWTQKNLIDRFLDYFIPLAELSVQHGLSPIFPPLQPGGDYWDTVFLQSALSKMNDLNSKLINHLQLSSYVWTWQKSLNWGAGGPQRWPHTRPYSSPNDPDQRGFRNFEWYLSIAQTILNRHIPIHLLGTGLPTFPSAYQANENTEEEYSERAMQIVHVLTGETEYQKDKQEEEIEPISQDVLSANFWLLSAEPEHEYCTQAWFQKKGFQLPVVNLYKQWISKRGEKEEVIRQEKRRILNLQSFKAYENIQKPTQKSEINHPGESSTGFITAEKGKPLGQQNSSTHQHNAFDSSSQKIRTIEKILSPDQSTNQPLCKPKAKPTGFNRPIQHYLLLPIYEWGVADWHLDVIRPFVKKYRATVGFSIKEAALAKKVTVVGNTQSFPEELLDKLRKAGCEVERINGDGTSIATQLATR